MIKKVLIANRGEIARRIIRTTDKLNIDTVAVYAEPDSNAIFVREAGEAVSLGGRTPLESYLDIEKIIGAAKKTGCDAVHPGYGFLSENPLFVNRCQAEGLTFIGPTAEAIGLMGDKAEARKVAKRLGVPTVPGSEIMANLAEAEEVCPKIGFPLLLKAAAGGRGIGMRLLSGPEELAAGFTETADRAGVAFGDKRVYAEKYLDQPHHIEIQVLRDHHGNLLTFFERECSVQRRYQKVIEESPSTAVDSELRRKLREAARKLAEGIGYLNAGTIEFVVDGSGNFYFLEANTRLQVEHPVTELITGIDFVEQQIQIVSGETLKLRDEDLEHSGWAIEARIYAEDPKRFFPSPGTITEYLEPKGEGIRVDSGYEAGSVITPYYDPLLAKLIAHGETRSEAIGRLEEALKGFQITGLKTNIPFLLEVVASRLFIDGGYDTHFIKKMTQVPPG
ncbi:MAG: biotin carboxylase [Firmicutes bacterium ML8_F2]|nr:MAG: biotin carboxylase [Firmicutes bacterium ML8_F2]